MQRDIHESIEKALQALGVSNIQFTVERPAEFSHGDYSTNAALVAANALGKTPRDVAKDLREKLEESFSKRETLLSAIQIAGPGFINFFLAPDTIDTVVAKAASDEEWGTGELYKNKTVMVEYTDPNPFKEFHIGHLMSNSIGEAIARTLENAGVNVIRANYQGDVGLHVAKAIWGKMQFPDWQWGAVYTHGAQEYETNTEAKKEIDDLNRKVYEKTDEQVNDLYRKGRELSLERFEEIYKILGTKFEHYFFESQTGAKGLELVKKHIDDGVFEMSDGTTIFKGEKVGLHTRVFINSKDLPTYEAKDLGLMELKKETVKFNESITVTASEQNDYFKVVLAAAREIPEIKDVADVTRHVSHGMMRFAEGKMSSRKGNVITGESLLADLQTAAKEKMGERELADANKTAEQVAVGAIKYAVLKQGSGKDIIFDPEKSLSLEGDSGPYLQYAHTRALSLLRKAEVGVNSDEATESLARGETWPSGPERTESTALSLESVSEKTPLARFHLQRALVHFPDVVQRAARELEPHYVTTYLTELASLFNTWYANERVIGTAIEDEGLELARAFANTMRRGLSLLGIPAPEEM